MLWIIKIYMIDDFFETVLWQEMCNKSTAKSYSNENGAIKCHKMPYDAIDKLQQMSCHNLFLAPDVNICEFCAKTRHGGTGCAHGSHVAYCSLIVS